MHFNICLVKGSDTPNRCVQLLSRDSTDGNLRGPQRPLGNEILELQCDAPDWLTAPQDNPCYKTPLDYDEYESSFNSILNYKYSLIPQNIEINFDVLSIDQSKQRFDAIKRAHKKRYGY